MSEEKVAVANIAEEKNLAGLGGWLILVGLGIFASPIRIVMQLGPQYMGIFSDGSWSVLTTPGSEAYNPLWAPILIAELGINAALILVWGYIGYLFFTKKSVFPKWYIGILIFTLIFILVDTLAIKAVLPDEPLFDPDTLKELGRTLVAVLIWVPYMLVSKRVKATFVK
jgi:hypothetical protein